MVTAILPGPNAQGARNPASSSGFTGLPLGAVRWHAGPGADRGLLFEALGATTKAVIFWADLEGLDADEQGAQLHQSGRGQSPRRTRRDGETWTCGCDRWWCSSIRQLFDALQRRTAVLCARASWSATPRKPPLHSRGQDAEARDQLGEQGTALVEADEDELAAPRRGRAAQERRPGRGTMYMRRGFDRIEADQEVICSGSRPGQLRGHAHGASRVCVLLTGTDWL